MKVVWLTGEPFRAIVDSETRPGMTHLVDLIENQCACEDWEIRCKGVPDVFCKHIEAAMIDLCAQFLEVFRRSPRITGCPSATSPPYESRKSPSTSEDDVPF